MTPPDNPPAFPVAWGGDLMPEHGMTLRDYFAGQALVGLTSRPEAGNSTGTAVVSYRIADAMLAARNL